MVFRNAHRPSRWGRLLWNRAAPARRSGGVERNARIGDDAAARKADIPIVQLNPGGTLNHKYAGEAAVRGAGLPYAVIRSTGAAPAGAPALLPRGTCPASGALMHGPCAECLLSPPWRIYDPALPCVAASPGAALYKGPSWSRLRRDAVPCSQPGPASQIECGSRLAAAHPGTLHPICHRCLSDLGQQMRPHDPAAPRRQA